ncbi:MAG: protein translocase subunit SecF [Clostridia bacterium]|nr:protein translocase subunit SecF [Clostridia bacterium]
MNKINDKLDALSGKLYVANKTKVWMLVPAIMVLVTIIMFSIFAAVNKDFSKGVNLGLDFTGGSSVTVSFNNDLTEEQFKDYGTRIVKVIQDVAGEHGESYDVSEPQRTGSGVDTAIYVKYQNGNSDIKTVNQEISNGIVAEFSSISITAEDNISIQSISASAAKKLAKEAIIAVLITWAVILVYVMIRFEIWSGIAAVVGLIFDVLTMVCCTIIFHIQVNTVFIAALITIVAYSINNTIVVFDRVRERMKLRGESLNKDNVASEVDIAVQDSLNRSIATTITTMITVLLLTIIGVDSIRQFTLPVMFGLISGVFTSLFIAPSLYVTMRKARFAYIEKKNAYKLENEYDTETPRAERKKRNVKANVSKKYKRVKK